jgi:phosphatidate cytidylyltransferase
MSLLQNKNFQTRALTGAIFVGLIVTAIFINLYSYLALLFAINFFCLNEFYSLTMETGQKFFKTYALIVNSIFALLLICELPFFMMEIKQVILYIAFLVSFLLLFLMIFIQLAYDSTKPFTNLAFSYFGMLYISTPVFLLFLLSFDVFSGYKPFLALLIFVLVWVNDTGAYLAGNLFGRTKLFERISPKKTWEGMFGGILLCMLLALPYGKYVLKESPLIYCGLGLVIGVFSTLGDLLESQLKRSLAIKDSGNILPGHGGFLDRFDGFLMAVPAAYLYLLLVR